jgi:hypothetical protein
MWSCHYAQTAQQKREQRAQITHRRISAASKNPNEKRKRLHWYMVYCCRCVEQGIITKHSMRMRVLSLERCVKQCWAYLQPNAVQWHQVSSDARAAQSESDS